MPPVRQGGGSGDRLDELLHSVRNCALPRREPKFKRVGHLSLDVPVRSFGRVTLGPRTVLHPTQRISGSLRLTGADACCGLPTIIGATGIQASGMPIAAFPSAVLT